MAEAYEVIELLGSGTFAQTWRARVIDRKLREEWGVDEVALKCPISHEKARALKKEVELNASLFLDTASMKSPNIVRYYGFDIYKGQIVLITEYIRDGDLRKEIGEIGSRKKVGEERSLEIITGILHGLKVIHEKNIIHRDIKPENILIDKGIPKIADFGVGRFMGSCKYASTTTGTLYYMPPELLFDAYDFRVTYNSDIWSVGVIFYEMLFGKFPFNIDYKMPPGSIIQMISDADVEAMFSKKDTVSNDVKDIIVRSLKKDPKDRYQSANDMLYDLESLTNNKIQITSEDDDLEQEISTILQLAKNAQNIVDIQKELLTLSKKHPREVRIYRALGEFFNCRSDNDNAIKYFLKGIACCKNDALSFWGLGMSYMKKNENYKAIQHLKSAIKFGLEPGREKYAKLLIDKLSKQLMKY